MEREHRQSIPVSTELRWLIFTCYNDRKVQTFCTIGTSGTSVELKSIPEPNDNDIKACYHGWLFLANENHNLWSLWNPITYDLINLPILPSELINTMKINSCTFTTSPKNPGCRFMLFDDSSTAVVYCQLGDHSWTKHDYRSDLLEIVVQENKVGPLNQFACLDGVIYAKASYSHVVAIEFDNQTGVMKFKSPGFKLPNTRMFTGCSYKFFVESFGELYAVYMFVHRNWKQIFCIKVFKLDFSTKVWVEVDNLDGRLLFLTSQGDCTLCLATETGIRGNQIYFITPEDKHLYMYDLEEGTILKSLPCPSLQTPWYESFNVIPEYPHINNQVKGKPEYKISTGLEQQWQHTKVEVQSSKDMESIADHYPLDIFTEIANNLGPLDYLEFRATCRLFRSAALATQWSVKSISSALESPWLVTLRYNKSIFSFH